MNIHLSYHTRRGREGSADMSPSKLTPDNQSHRYNTEELGDFDANLGGLARFLTGSCPRSPPPYSAKANKLYFLQFSLQFSSLNLYVYINLNMAFIHCTQRKRIHPDITNTEYHRSITTEMPDYRSPMINLENIYTQ